MTATNPDDNVMDSETVGRIPMTSRIFAISGSFPTVRSCLLKRGWIEKKHRFHFCTKTEPYMWPFKHDLLRNNEPRGINKDVNDNSSVEDTPEIKSETDIIEMASYLLNYYPPTLIWTSRKDAISYNHLLKNQIVNHFNQSGFTTKVALCSVIHNLNWTCDVDPDKIFPRCFNLAKQVERDAFVENFRLTACFNVVKWLIKKAGIWNSTIIDKDCIIVPERLIKFAFVQCLAFLSSKNHDDIEETCEDIICAETDWDWFIGWTYQLKNDNCIFFEWENYLLEFHKIAGAIQKVWPQWNIDGDRNVWILKPAAKSRGQGIIITESLHDIMGLVGSCNNSNYVVQKYIEQPLLIGGVKFDIRQWFLVTDYNPLTMWMYRDSYLRFCSMLFTLDHKDASIHLCNNSIQCNFLKSAKRLSTLPEGNMITNEEFKKILANRGHEDAWNNIIYPGMKSAIISVLCSAQEQMIGRKNCFELYGADFMVDEKLQPWLIEINSSPCLAPSTPVTKRLCSNVIEDLFKVVLDRRINDNCSIGHFELGYQADPLPRTESCASKLVLTGNNIEKFIAESPKCSRLYNLMTNRNILSLKQVRPKFEESTISENLTPWYASKFYKNSCNHKFNTSYIDKIVNDIKNNKKYSYYSVTNGTMHPESRYVVPQMYSTFKNQKSFINFKSNNNSTISLEKKYLKHSKLEKLIKSECNSKERDIRQISKQEKLKADLHRKAIENIDLKTKLQNQTLTKKKLTDAEMKRSPDINIKTLAQSYNTDKQQTLKLLNKEQNSAKVLNKFNSSKKNSSYRSSNDSNNILYRNQITAKTSIERKMNKLLKEKFESNYPVFENKSNGNPLNMQKFDLKHSKMIPSIHIKKSIKNR